MSACVASSAVAPHVGATAITTQNRLRHQRWAHAAAAGPVRVRSGGARRCRAVTSAAVAEGNAFAVSPAAAALVKENKKEWNSLGSVCAVLGSQWGDEGKGKLVDILAQEYDIVARCQGGANAGHTIYDDAGKKYALHLIPSGILNEKCTCVVGNGVVVHLPGMFDEIDKLTLAGIKTEGRLVISDRAHMLFDLHKEVDGLREAELSGNKIGTTKRGIGPAYASKATRNGLRVGDIRKPERFEAGLRALAADAAARFPDFEYDVEAEIVRYREYAKRVEPFIADTVQMVNEQHAAGKRVLVEGANATMLDLDFGTYPFVTSSNPSLGGVCAGLGLAPNKFQTVIGVAKAYTTRVGAGPYPTELFDTLAEDLRAKGFEYGTTTGRPRRIGWLDIVALNYASAINGFTHINLTKLDVLSGLPELKVGVEYILPCGTHTTAFPSDIDDLAEVKVVYETLPGWSEDISGVRLYKDLPPACRAYVERIEELCKVECRYIGVGPGRDAIVIKP